jgi:ankyrin repeat protein
MQNGATPLCVASENGHRPVVDLLLAKGANINHIMKVCGM